MATKLGSGFIELTVKYSGVAGQVKRELGDIEQDSKKTSDAIQSHVEKSVSSVGSVAEKAIGEAQKAHEEYRASIAQTLADEKKLKDAQNAFYQTQKGDLNDLVELRKKASESAIAQDTAMYNSLKKHGEELKSQGRDLGTNIRTKFQAEMAEMARGNAETAGFMGKAITTAVVQPLAMGIRGIKHVFSEVWDFALSTAKMAVFGIAGAITAGIGSAFYQGIKRLDTLADVRLKLKYDGLSTADSEQVISDMRTLANKLAMPLNDMLNQGEVFAAAGVKPGQDMIRVMEDAANVAAKSGQSIQSVSDTMLRFMEGNTQRASFALQTWQNNGVNIMGWLADELGTTNDMVIDMLQKGEISWAQVQKAIEDHLAGFAEASGQTIGDKIRVVWEKIADIGEAALAPFFGGAVGGFTSVIEKMDTWAQWIRDHQPQIVELVGKIGAKFFEIAQNVTVFAATVMDAFAGITHAAGTIFDKMGQHDTAKSLFEASDQIKSAGDALRETLPFWQQSGAAVSSYFENLDAGVRLTGAGAIAKLVDENKILLTGTEKQIAETKGILNNSGLDASRGDYQTVFDKDNHATGVQILPNSDASKRFIDDYRAAIGKEPLYMDVYLKFHPQSGDKYAPDGTTRMPGEANRMPAGTQATTAGGKPPGASAWDFGNTPEFEQTHGYEILWKILRHPVDSILGDLTTPLPGAAGKPANGVRPVPAPQGFGPVGPVGTAGADTVPFNPGPQKPGVPVPITADIAPALESVKGLTDGIVGVPPTPAPVTADVEAGKTVISDYLKGITQAEPTAAPLTADVEEAQKQYKQFADLVKSNPLAIPMIASIMGGGGGGGITGASGLTQQSVALKDSIHSMFPQIRDIGGWRPPDGKYNEHSSGQAIDIMIPKELVGTPAGTELGNAIKQYALTSGIAQYALWQQTQWNPDGTSSGMENRGDPTQNHFDHVHIRTSTGAFTAPVVGAPVDISASFGPSGLPGVGGFRPGGGMGGAGLSRTMGLPLTPMLPGIDDTDTTDTTTPTAPTTPWTPVGIPGIDPTHANAPKTTVPGIDPDASYLPDTSGYLAGIGDMTQPGISPAEREKLDDLVAKLDSTAANLENAKLREAELRANSKTKPSAMQAAENKVKRLAQQVEDLQQGINEKISLAAQSTATDATGLFPDDAGFFTDRSQFMTSPNITPEEADRLVAQTDKVNDMQRQLDQLLLSESEDQLKDRDPSQVVAANNRIKQLTRDLSQERGKLTEITNLSKGPGDYKDKGKKGKWSSYWDQTLGEFVQRQMGQIGQLGDIASGGMMESLLPEGFSDPTSWPMTKSAAGLMGWLGGVVPDPTAAGILGMGSSLLGGSGSGAQSAIMSMIPEPFGTSQLGSPGEAPGAVYDPLLAPAGGGSAGLPLGILPGPDAFGQHLPAGATPGQPVQPGPGGNVTYDNSIKVQGDSATAVTDAAVNKMTTHQAPVIRNALKPLGAG